jgi:hypothetical protein
LNAVVDVQEDLASWKKAGRRRSVFLSRSITFHDAEGRSMTVTSQHPADDERFAGIRDSAPMNTYLATPEGWDKAQARRETGQPLDRVEVEWRPASIPVDGHELAFEVCDIAQGWWAGVGRAPDAVITIDSRGVPLQDLRLERVPEHPVPPLPDLGEVGHRVADDLDSRVKRLPLRRVRRTSDYWALHAVEIDHVQDLARRYYLSDHDRQAVQDHWLARLNAELGETMEHLLLKPMDSAYNSRIGRHLRGRDFLYQLWSNTVGPGAKTWFGNRYAPIRRRTFRLRWRP